MLLQLVPLITGFVAGGAGLNSAMALPLTFNGSMLGVHARVELLLEERRAKIRLSGLPLGGTLEGEASFDEDNNVVMDDEFACALRRRMVAVVGVQPHVDMQSLQVHVTLPLLGRRTLRMDRAS
jgi:hypothetical protein